MKFTLSWLKDHLDTEASLEAIAEMLTKIGLEVEGIEDKAAALKPYVVANVISAEQHPNADRLRVCMVDAGDGAPLQVVCGAPNARAAMKSVFAPPGTYVPGKNITLSVGTIRGVESRGMLCSGAELGLGEDHDGILDLPADAPIGMSYALFAGLDDPVIEINLTPNRSDCASIHGIARDLAATGIGTLKGDAFPQLRGEGVCPVPLAIELGEDRDLCPYFTLRLVRGVKNGPSPDWMQARLRAIGLRPINALVDITNYLTFDRGRPLHVFDAKKVAGGLTVRLAREGEELKALDGRTHRLDAETVVIADQNGVESIGGIIGGEASGCDQTTTDVLIESALWNPRNIARTGRRLGVITDARYRFERGVDPAFTLPGLDAATRLVLDICGGTASQTSFAGEPPESDHVIDFPWTEVRRLAGIELSRAEMKVTLESLGFHVAGSGDRVKVLTPSWRPDVEGKADLVEEIIRIAGLDRIEPKPLLRPETSAVGPKLTVLQRRTRNAKRALASRGLFEAVTWSFIRQEDAHLFGGGRPDLSLANPIASDLSDMRPSLVPGLLRGAQANADRGYGDVALFEVGQCFESDQPEGQTIRAAGVRRGTARHAGAGRHWSGTVPVVDAFEAKADALALLTAVGIQTGGLQIVAGGPEWLHPGRSGTLQFGPKNPVGWFGEIHPKAMKALDLKGTLVAFEITLDALPLPKYKPTKVKPALALSDLQAVSRDFAFVVGRDVAAADVIRAAQGAERKLITGVDVFDIYEGVGIPENAKSIAVAVRLQPVERTLTDAEIEAVSAKIVAEVAKKTGATLRG
ncbi:phenylalanine--tRNA ligase subunit beta [Methylobacterium brachythecii]|uniref:Phenylalanine--tRNA ligase beta subunit n=1 Tax=Methylobacterium brachythecii TaxID=1176177 RepID=A0A7W6F7Y1_9HYPH|nr:phenylalanine--tRNA ligase subunit beta [Methylobacterium brachythecii]MBB3903888.1 phenylalanyl-tRNA synthetase beta chain [Methylobacterium brachythecii]GLS42637.1 phenylalanine--tRNA ligase beta subunit [Methylobacterium brachythecii]